MSTTVSSVERLVLHGCAETLGKPFEVGYPVGKWCSTLAATLEYSEELFKNTNAGANLTIRVLKSLLSGGVLIRCLKKKKLRRF